MLAIKAQADQDIADFLNKLLTAKLDVGGLLALFLVISAIGALVYLLKFKPTNKPDVVKSEEENKLDLIQSWIKITSDLTEALNPIKSLPDIEQGLASTKEALSNLVVESRDNTKQHIEFMAILRTKVVPVMENAEKAVTKMSDNMKDLKPLIEQLINQLSQGIKLSKDDTNAIVDNVSQQLSGTIEANNTALIAMIKQELDSRGLPSHNPTMIQSKDETEAKAKKREGK